jgi:outer membrane protein assembly factor BamB
LLIVFALVLAACDWPMLGFGPGHTGFNPLERTINASNVDDVTPSWTGVLGGSSVAAVATPVVVDGVVYMGHTDGKFYAFDATGTTNCSGTPKTCAPLWTAMTDDYGVTGTAAIANGVAFVTTRNKLYAFDATGETNCAGLPKTCTPLWTAEAGVQITPRLGSPAVAGNTVYVIDDRLYAYDARGEIGCSGTSKTCEPMWTADTLSDGIPSIPGTVISSSPAIAGTVVYTAGGDGTGAAILRAFDARGVTNCGGSPKACAPLWIGRPRCGSSTAVSQCDVSTPAVSEGRVYVSTDTENVTVPDGALSAFSASGGSNCNTAAPPSCEPVWSAVTLGSSIAPAIANGVAYVASVDKHVTGPPIPVVQRFPLLVGFDIAACSNGPCDPVWTSSSNAGNAGEPSIANGVAYFGGRAYDTSGQMGCTGDPPHCLFVKILGDVSRTATIVDGVIYLGGNDNTLLAYRLPSDS